MTRLWVTGLEFESRPLIACSLMRSYKFCLEVGSTPKWLWSPIQSGSWRYRDEKGISASVIRTGLHIEGDRRSLWISLFVFHRARSFGYMFFPLHQASGAWVSYSSEEINWRYSSQIPGWTSFLSVSSLCRFWIFHLKYLPIFIFCACMRAFL